MNLGATLQAFAAVLPAELPDKTMVATVALVARHRRPLPVWCGAAAAFTLHVTLAVGAGRILAQLPPGMVGLATAMLFAVGAVLLWRSAGDADVDDEPGRTGAAGSPVSAFAGSFGVIALAELGDLTQLITAGMAASTGSPTAVAVGALLALWIVAGVAAAVGGSVTRRLPTGLLQRVAAVVFAAFAALALLDLT